MFALDPERQELQSLAQIVLVFGAIG